jgi:formylglycine-generating enzyme required for sulfatase activity
MLCAGSVVAQIGSPSTANMAWIPGSTFDMGINAADIPKLQEKFNIKRPELFSEESPRHRATIASFYLDRTEVTNAQFKLFVDRNSQWQKEKIGAQFHNGKYLQHWNGNEFPPGQENYPVVFVSWYSAAAFCSSHGKRLPTEAEWEFAAHGGLTGKDFPWGDEMPDKTRANYLASGLNKPTAVASYVANGYGLHDMAGNVWEFLADEWHKYPIPAKSESPGATSKPNSGARRALRGGSFGGSPVNLRVTYRDSHASDNAVEHVGFRCAMTSPVQSEAVNELLRLHYEARAAHFNRDAKSLLGDVADDYVNVDAGQVKRLERDANLKRMQSYLDASTFLEWDDITPPIIRVSDDSTMAYVINHKKVRRLAKDKDGKMHEAAEVFAWVANFRKIDGKWKLAMVASTRTPEADK